MLRDGGRFAPRSRLVYSEKPAGLLRKTHSHVGTSLIASRLYGEMISQQYSSDAGVEHAIWRLTYGGLAGDLTAPGDNTTYQLGEAINGIKPDIFVIRTDNVTFEITSVAGDNTIQAVVAITGENVTVRQWQINP